MKINPCENRPGVIATGRKNNLSQGFFKIGSSRFPGAAGADSRHNREVVGHYAIYGRLVLVGCDMKLVISELEFEYSIRQATDKILHQPGGDSYSAGFFNF